MGGGNDTTVQSNDVPDWVRPYAQNYMQASQNVANRPYQAYDQSTVANLNPYQTAGYNAQAQRAMQGNQTMDAAAGEVNKTLGGGYLNSNPYLDSMVDRASQDVQRNMTSVDARSGSFGNSGVQEATARGLADVSANIRGADYQQERGRMAGAVNQAQGIANQDYTDAERLINAGQGFQQQDQAQRSDDYNRFLEARNYPEHQLGILGQGLGMNRGSSSTSTSPGANPWAQAAGAYLAYNGLGGGGK
jgi:hypothetical protein